MSSGLVSRFEWGRNEWGCGWHDSDLWFRIRLKLRVELGVEMCVCVFIEKYAMGGT